MRKSGKPVAGPSSEQFVLPRFGQRKPFLAAEKKAREVLREKGFSESEIQAELKRAHPRRPQ